MNEQILLVDDEEANLRLLTQRLVPQDYGAHGTLQPLHLYDWKSWQEPKQS
jgi:CheY-like chemotaxis protein